MENSINPEIYGPLYHSIEDNSELVNGEDEHFACPIVGAIHLVYKDHIEKNDEDLKYVDGWMVRRVFTFSPLEPYSS